MGVDFITKCTPSFQRSWDRNKEELIQKDLFSKHPDVQGRTFRAIPTGGACFANGEKVILRVVGAEIHVVRGHSHIGAIENPPAGLIQTIKDEGCSVAFGVIKKVYEYSGDAEIAFG